MQFHSLNPCPTYELIPMPVLKTMVQNKPAFSPTTFPLFLYSSDRDITK